MCQGGQPGDERGQMVFRNDYQPRTTSDGKPVCGKEDPFAVIIEPDSEVI
jgi:hypothetical protein